MINDKDKVFLVSEVWNTKNSKEHPTRGYGRYGFTC
jgi:hypothetical protein